LVFDAVDSRLDLLVGIDFGTVVSAAPHPDKKFNFFRFLLIVERKICFYGLLAFFVTVLELFRSSYL
jgi:hypothetical protein